MADRWVFDAHRHLGSLPAFPFYGVPALHPDITAKATVEELFAAMDGEGTARSLVIPDYGVPDPAVAFSFNELCVEAASRDERVRAGLWVSPLPADTERTRAALRLAGEPGVRALELSFLLGGAPDEPACPMLDEIFATAREHHLVAHVHTSPGAASDIDRVGRLVDAYADHVAVHLVHVGGGMSGHIKLIGSRFFDWVAAGKRVYADLPWTIGVRAAVAGRRDLAAWVRPRSDPVRQRRALG